MVINNISFNWKPLKYPILTRIYKGEQYSIIVGFKLHGYGPDLDYWVLYNDGHLINFTKTYRWCIDDITRDMVLNGK